MDPKKQANGEATWGDLQHKAGDAWDDAKDTPDDLRDRDEDADRKRDAEPAERPV